MRPGRAAVWDPPSRFLVFTPLLSRPLSSSLLFASPSSVPRSSFISRCCTRCDINTMNSGTRRVKTMARDLDGGGEGKSARNIFPKHLPAGVRHAGGSQNCPFLEMLPARGGGRVEIVRLASFCVSVRMSVRILCGANTGGRGRRGMSLLLRERREGKGVVAGGRRGGARVG